MTNAIYWPYDEVTLKAGSLPTEFRIETPWLGTVATLNDDQVGRARQLVGKFESQQIGPQDISELNWFFGALARFPFCYNLPRAVWPVDVEPFHIRDSSLLLLTPPEFLASAVSGTPHETDAETVAKSPLFDGPWKWDAEGAIQFASSPKGIDPIALFTVARRFHLLSAMESNSTERLYSRVKEMSSRGESVAWVSALMVRQNHYVTERCHHALTPALENARSAKEKVRHFIDEEYGHDRILKAALLTLTEDPSSIPVTSQSKVLMDLLEFAATRNFLGFAMVVDFFERSSYQHSDPLAQVLAEVGSASAARHIDRHHKINDVGEHENVAVGFLETMGPVEAEYATEALRIGEVTTNVMNLIASGVEEMLERQRSEKVPGQPELSK